RRRGRRDPGRHHRDPRRERKGNEVLLPGVAPRVADHLFEARGKPWARGRQRLDRGVGVSVRLEAPDEGDRALGGAPDQGLIVALFDAAGAELEERGGDLVRFLERDIDSDKGVTFFQGALSSKPNSDRASGGGRVEDRLRNAKRDARGYRGITQHLRARTETS